MKMNRILLSLMFYIISSSVFAQYDLGPDSAAIAEPDDVIESICGVDFGACYEDAKTALVSKFGYYDSEASDRNMLIFNHKTYAGIQFDRLIFGFQWNRSRSYMNGCVMLVECKTAEDAKNRRDYLARVLSKKYYLDNDIDKNKFKYYKGGTSPTDYDDYGLFIDVLKYEAGVNPGYPYAARIYYGTYDYIGEEF